MIDIGNSLINSSFVKVSSLNETNMQQTGFYCIKLKEGHKFPNAKYQTLYKQRKDRIIYVGIAYSQNLSERLVKGELRGEKAATFFRDIGTILQYQPIKRKGNSKSSISNYTFSTQNIQDIRLWINDNLEVNYVPFEGEKKMLEEIETDIIKKYVPFLNIKNNPQRLQRLKFDRKQYREKLKKEI